MRKYKFYSDSRQTWTAMLSKVEDARLSIYWESFTFVDDTGPDFDFVEALCKKSREGLVVKVVLDAIGSLGLTGGAIKRLRDAGVEVLFYKTFFSRIHKKILIIDEKFSFLGGVNIGQLYLSWLDLHLYLESRKISMGLLRSFAKSYLLSGGEDTHLREIANSAMTQKTKTWLLDHFPVLGSRVLYHYYRDKVGLAEKNVVMVSPYFFPHHWLVKSLRSAIKRGVLVEVLLPAKSDYRFFDFANLFFASLLIKDGVVFYLVPGMVHAKALLVDRKEGLVGSNNLDALSFDFNIEASLSFVRKDMIKDFERIINGWKKVGKKFNPSDYRRKWYFPLLEFFIKILRPIL